MSIMSKIIYNLLNYETHPDTDAFINTLGSYYFHPQILKPTRITDHTATLIDNIFFNSLEHLTLSGNIVSDISDHLPNFLIINKISELPNSNLNLFKRNYSRPMFLILIGIMYCRMTTMLIIYFNHFILRF